jgi:hypothetical protein
MDMRSSKSVWIAVVAAALIVASAVGVAAQSSDEMPPVHVTGAVHFDDADPFEPPTSTTGNGDTTEFRGMSAVRQLSMTDERLSGSQHAVWNQFDYGNDGSTVAGRLSIENDGGSWEGTYQGVIFPHAPGMARHQAVLVSEGGYEGLSAVLYYDPASTDDSLNVEGYIFRGVVPGHPSRD